LAGKSTLNRLEHAPAAGAPSRYRKIGHDSAAIEKQFVDLFLDAHAKPPREIVLNLDAGHQEGRFSPRLLQPLLLSAALSIFGACHHTTSKISLGIAPAYSY
jgi:hypothetical protein